MKKPRHPVTDHAVLRYLERARGIDTEAVRAILGQRVDAALAMGPGASAVVVDGLRLILEDGVVVTAAPRHTARIGHVGRKKLPEADE